MSIHLAVVGVLVSASCTGRTEKTCDLDCQQQVDCGPAYIADAWEDRDACWERGDADALAGCVARCVEWQTRAIDEDGDQERYDEPTAGVECLAEELRGPSGWSLHAVSDASLAEVPPCPT